MNIFSVLIVVLFVMASIVEAYHHRWLTCQIYIASAWLNVVFMGVK